MLKRAALLIAAIVAIGSILAFTVSPVSPTVAWAALTAAPIHQGKNKPAPHSGREALKLLRVDVMKLASDYAHKRYRAVCSDLTKKELKHLGGTSQCMLKIAIINAFVPIKKFTIVAAKLSKGRLQATVAIYVNGNRKHLIHAIVHWQGGAYRLDHQSGWHPTL